MEIRDWLVHWWLYRRNALHNLIVVSVLVYVALGVVEMVGRVADSGVLLRFYRLAVDWLAVHADWRVVMRRPWGVVTYAFLHAGFWHLLFNMLWLYWFGEVMLVLFGCARHLVRVFFGGVVGGALLYVLLYNILPGLSAHAASSYLVGASAGVMAVGLCGAVVSPGYRIYLFLVGAVPLWVLVAVMVVLDFVGMGGSNTGGHIAHLGGAAVGVLYARWLRGGLQLPVGSWRVWLFPLRKKRGRRSPHSLSDKELKELNRILDKLLKEGYDSLTPKERDYLRRLGN